METTHTKGEWYFKDNMVYSDRSDGDTIAIIQSTFHSKPGGGIPEAEQQANGLLISAAPDLLNALQTLNDAMQIISEHHSTDYKHSLTARIVSDAIYKATNS